MTAGGWVVLSLAALLLASCDASADGPTGTASHKAAAASGDAGTPSSDVLNRAVIEGRMTPVVDLCMKSGDAAKGVTYAMFDCLAAELAAQDQALNAAYQTVLTASRLSDAEAARSNPDDEYGSGWTARIIEAQKAWVGYRDGKCLTENYPDGQLYRFYGYPNCQITETIKRTIELEELKRFIEEY